MKIRLGDVLNAVEELNDYLQDIASGVIKDPPEVKVKIGKSRGKTYEAVITVRERVRR